MNIKAAIFDLDGTLVDSEELFIEALQQVLAKQGFTMGHDELVEVCWGRSWQGIFNEILRRGKTSFNTFLEMTEAVDLFIEEADLQIAPIKGSVALVKNLYGDLPLCIVSGSTRAQIRHAAKSCGIDSYLDFYLGAEDYSEGKPSPECYLKAAEMLNLKPSECVVFEDSVVGVEAAKAAGMYCVGLSEKGLFDLSAADQVRTCLRDFHPRQIQPEGAN